MPTKVQKREHRRRYEEQKARGGVMFRGKMTLPEELAEIFRPRLVQDCGAYIIWKYDVEAPITVFGHTFNGMKDVMRCVQLSAVCGFGKMSILPEVPELAVPGIYCARIFQPYPEFDVYDLGDSRSYVNVFFSRVPFTPDRLAELCGLDGGYNFCMVHDRLPADALPVLYRDGDSLDMLYASVSD